MHAIGIDLAWKSGNPSGVAVVNEKLELVAYDYPKDIGQIMQTVRRFPDARIGVDAPLVIANQTGHRPNEQAFLKVFSRYGLGVHAANRQLFDKRFQAYAGYALYAALREAGIDFSCGRLFEVYPHATILACFNNGRVLPYKSGPVAKRKAHLAWLQEQLFATLAVDASYKKEINVLRGKALKAQEDFLDALVCAWSLHYCRKHDCHRFGSDSQGILLVPRADASNIAKTPGCAF